MVLLLPFVFVLHIYVYGLCLGLNPIKLNLFISLIDQVIDFLVEIREL